MTSGVTRTQEIRRAFMKRLRSLGHRRARAVAHLLTGSWITVMISLIWIGLAARALGPDDYGVLALILTLGQACERILSFQSWQPLIRYGAALDDESGREDLRSLYKFGLLLDLAGSVAAWATASLLAIAGHYLFAISWPHVGVTLIFMIALLFNFNGTSTAVFRLTGRFEVSARLQVLVALVRLAASVGAFLMGAGLLGWVIVWAATQVLGSLLNLAVSIGLLHRRGLTRIARASLADMSARFPELWRFTWGANFSLTIWSSAQQFDTLVVGWLIDPAAAGMYQLSKRVGRVVQQVGSQVEAVVYPDLSRLWAAGDRAAFTRLILQTEMVLASFGGLCVLAALMFGEWAVTLAAGEKFAAAAPLLTVQILAVAMTISGAASRAGLLSMGRQPAILRTVLVATGLFYVAIVPLTWHVGAMGANIAQLLFGAAWLGGLAVSLRRGLRRDAEGNGEGEALAAGKA